MLWREVTAKSQQHVALSWLKWVGWTTIFPADALTSSRQNTSRHFGKCSQGLQNIRWIEHWVEPHWSGILPWVPLAKRWSCSVEKEYFWTKIIFRHSRSGWRSLTTHWSSLFSQLRTYPCCRLRAKLHQTRILQTSPSQLAAPQAAHLQAWKKELEKIKKQNVR